MNRFSLKILLSNAREMIQLIRKTLSLEIEMMLEVIQFLPQNKCREPRRLDRIYKQK